MGQVCYVFSDKTGTLTCNKMVFKYCVIGVNCYEYVKDNTYDAQENNFRKEMNIQTIGPLFMSNLVRSSSGAVDRHKYKGFTFDDINGQKVLNMEDERIVVDEFWKCLSTAHECVCNDKDDKFEYSGLSPDDIELVNTASEQGYSFMKSQSDIRRIKVFNDEKEFNILRLMEFNSDRKRIGIIVRESGIIKLYMKGADSEIMSRLSKHSRSDILERSKQYVNIFSAKGYRTLLVAMRIITEDEYESWRKRLDAVELSHDNENKPKNLEKLYDEVERGLFILGATIVEDSLQKHVPETIRDLRLANIKVWMLTGDKLDTACNIALSCNLITRSLKLFKLEGAKGDTLEKLVNEYNDFIINRKIDDLSYAIVIDSAGLATILCNKEYVKCFIDISSYATSVICCRVTPLQKSEVVKIMKEHNPNKVTLSIGDGGNDVSMIMEAHIGIGIYGEEGMRAVQASDFAIGEFRILRRLLMCHGRTNYIRIAEMILYFFFKNFIFTMLHFYYAFYNNCSGQTVIDDWFISLYNMILTAFPLGIRAVIDQDLIVDDGDMVDKMLPFLYQETRDKPIFNYSSFIMTLFRGAGEAVINFYILYFTIFDSAIDSQGNTSDLWYFSVALYTNIIFIVSLRLLINSKYITTYNVLVMTITSWLFYIIFLKYVDGSDIFKSVGTMVVEFNSGKLYLSSILIIGSAGIIDFFTKSYDTLFNNTYSSMLQILKNKGLLDDIPSIPSAIINELYKYEIYENNNREEISRKPSQQVYKEDEENKYTTSHRKSLGIASYNQDKPEYMISEGISSSNISSHVKDKHRRYISYKNSEDALIQQNESIS